MIQKHETLSSKDFNKGLVTRADLLKPQFDQSPNTMNIKWYFDGAIGKRFGSSTTNTIQLGSTAIAGWIIDASGTLSTNLQAYWKLNEPSGNRFDEIGSLTLTDQFNVSSIVGIRNLAALFEHQNYTADSQGLVIAHNSSLSTNTNLTISAWIYLDQTTSGALNDPGRKTIVSKRLTSGGDNDQEYDLIVETNNQIVFRVSNNGSSPTGVVIAASAGNLNTATWYNVIAWHSNNSHLGVSVNQSVNTAAYTGGIRSGSGGFFCIGGLSSGTDRQMIGRIDEVGLWNKVLTSVERADIYGGGSGNTYSKGSSSFGWGMFDFGASSIRWLSVAIGTGIVASSNMGTTFVDIATSRTQNYQSFERSKNVLICTSDSYDRTLYWAGSAGTFAIGLTVNSAPNAKYAVNYQGFLILLNYQDSNGTLRQRGFSYADENLQLTSAWTDNFDIPSTQDDEITGSFILSKFLYISTKSRLYRVAYVGGNPDWSYLKVKDWGFVPRTMKLITLKGGQVAVGLDWNRRMRAFDGYEDVFVSDNVENDNGFCDFAMKKISLAGSGLVISHAEVDTIEQEYRLNIAIGADSTQTTHAILLNGRTLSLYPYSNQLYQAMCMAESGGHSHLMAVDRSGYVHILNSGNLDVRAAIDDTYYSPILFGETPQQVLKSQNINTYLSVDSCGKVYYQDAVNLSNEFTPLRELVNLLGTEKKLLVEAALDVPSTFNTYQFALTSSSGTANPWKLSRWDFVGRGKGIGQG